MMKTKKLRIILLIAIFIASCAPSAKISSTEVVSQTSTTTPVPPTSTNTPVPSATPIPFDISGNFAIADQDSIHVYSLDGKKIRTIQAKGWVRNFKFSRQGKMVAYSANSKIGNDLVYYPYGLEIVHLANNKKNTVVEGGTRILDFFWDEVGQSLIYLTLGGVYRYSTDEMEKETLFNLAGGMFEDSNESAFDVYPSPSRQGFVVTQIILKQVDENRFNYEGINVYYFSLDQNNATKLNDEPYQNSGANRFGDWSPDSNYFSYRVETRSNVKTFVFNASSALLVDDYPDVYPIEWSPNSNFISQSRRDNQRSVLIRMGDFSTDWNEIYSVPSSGHNQFNTAWSPDSNLLAIALVNYASLSGQWLGVYNIQTTQLDVLADTLDIEANQIFWSPNGEYLLIADSPLGGIYPTIEICQFRIYSFSRNELISVPDVACKGVMSFQWLLDKKSFAFTAYSEYSQETRTPNVYILDTEFATIRDINVESIKFELIP